MEIDFINNGISEVYLWMKWYYENSPCSIEKKTMKMDVLSTYISYLCSADVTANTVMQAGNAEFLGPFRKLMQTMTGSTNI